MVRKKISTEDLEITNPDAINFMCVGKKTFIIKPIEVDPLEFKTKIEEFYKQKASTLAKHLIDTDFQQYQLSIDKIHGHINKRINESKCVVPDNLQLNGQTLLVFNKRVCKLKALIYSPQWFKICPGQFNRYAVVVGDKLRPFISKPFEQLIITVKPIIQIIIHYALNPEETRIYCFGETFHTMSGSPNYLCTGDATAKEMFRAIDDPYVRNSVNCFSLAADSIYGKFLKDFLENDNIIKVEKAEATTWKT